MGRCDGLGRIDAFGLLVGLAREAKAGGDDGEQPEVAVHRPMVSQSRRIENRHVEKVRIVSIVRWWLT